MSPRRLFFLLALASSACDARAVDEGRALAPDARAADELRERELRERELQPPCSWECRACPADAPCTQECVAAGSCESSCGLYLQCAPGYSWSEASCACSRDSEEQPALL